MRAGIVYIGTGPGVSVRNLGGEGMSCFIGSEYPMFI